MLRRTLASFVFLSVLIPPLAMAQWDVTYYVRSSTVPGTFYGPGTYQINHDPLAVPYPVYVLAPTAPGSPNPFGWVFLGNYGAPAGSVQQASLPSSFPSIAFAGSFDQAIVVVHAGELPIDRLRYHAPYWLQATTARAVARVTGGTALGATVLLPGVWLIVGPSCAGLPRIAYCVLMAVALGVFVKPWRWRLAMLGVAPLVGFALNVARIVQLVP